MRASLVKNCPHALLDWRLPVVSAIVLTALDAASGSLEALTCRTGALISIT